MLMLKRNATDFSKDKLLWKWVRGQSTTLTELQDPTDTAAYALCIYSGGNTLLGGVTVPPGAGKWSPLGTKGFKYLDANASAGGVKKIILKSGAQDNAKALVKGGGGNLPDPPAGPLTLPLTAQLHNLDTGLCVGGTYDALDVLKNDAGLFKAKH
jgi:hypothetical protein